MLFVMLKFLFKFSLDLTTKHGNEMGYVKNNPNIIQRY